MQVASEDYETIGVERPCNDIYCTMRHVSREEEIDTYWCLYGVKLRRDSECPCIAGTRRRYRVTIVQSAFGTG
jgi:hypothetical protein